MVDQNQDDGLAQGADSLKQCFLFTRQVETGTVPGFTAGAVGDEASFVAENQDAQVSGRSSSQGLAEISLDRLATLLVSSRQNFAPMATVSLVL